MKKGCRCNFDVYFNTETGECSEVKCENMDCVGKRNEAFYNCESGSRNSCECSKFVTLDCQTGKNQSISTIYEI